MKVISGFIFCISIKSIPSPIERPFKSMTSFKLTGVFNEVSCIGDLVIVDISVVVNHFFVVMDSDANGGVSEIPLCASLVNFVAVVTEEPRNGDVFVESRSSL